MTKTETPKLTVMQLFEVRDMVCLEMYVNEYLGKTKTKKQISEKNRRGYMVRFIEHSNIGGYSRRRVLPSIARGSQPGSKKKEPVVEQFDNRGYS